MSRGGAVCIALTSDQREPPCILHLSFTVEGGGGSYLGLEVHLLACVTSTHELSVGAAQRTVSIHQHHLPTPLHV